MRSLLDGLRALGTARLAAMAVVALGVLGLLSIMTLRSSGDRMALLYGDLDLRDAGQVTEQLDRAKIPHQLGAQGTTVLVPADQVAEARLLLARQGLPSGGSIGYEIFDRGDGLTANQFQQNINQTRAMEGELARSIRMIRGVRGARVHLVLARREPFAREQQEAQASVLLTMTGASRLDQAGVQAIVNLVAAAVPGLKPQNIAVVDSRGDLLARAGQPGGLGGSGATADEQLHGAEIRLAHDVEAMLEPTLGAGHVRAEATIQMDFDQLRQTEEKFDPDGQVPRSTQSVTNNSKTTEKDTTVSVQNNLPNADAGANAGNGTQESRQEETTNFEIGKTTRTLVHDQPQIKRISLAVMVDGVTAPGPDGKPVWQERSPQELTRIGALVRSAVGFDEKRGDQVEVVSMRFMAEPEPEAPPVGVFGLPLERADVMHLAETLLFGIVAVMTLLMVLRPMVMRLTTAPGAADALIHSGGALAIAGPDGAIAGAGDAYGAAALLEDESMVSLANIDGQLRASSIRRVVDLIERHPEESLTIMRGWMAQEQV